MIRHFQQTAFWADFKCAHGWERLEEQGDDGLLVEEVLHLQREGRRESLHEVIDVVCLADVQGIQHQFAGHGTAAVYLLHHAVIDLFPEAGHGAHAGGVDLGERAEDVLRMAIDSQRAAHRDAEIGPAAFEDVSVGQEVHHHLPVAHRERSLMGTHRGVVHSVGQHDTLAQPRRPARVQDIGQVVLVQLGGASVHLPLMLHVESQAQEVSEVDAHPVLLVSHDMAVKDDNLADARVYLQHAVCRVVLVLLAHEDIAYLGIAYHVLNLRLAARGIEGDGHRADAVRTEIHEQALGHVLREDGHVLLHADAQRYQGVAHEPYPPRKLVPRNALPSVGIIIPDHQCRAFAVYPCLTVHKC